MRNQRRCSLEFKRNVVEEFLSGGSGAAQLCYKYNICYGLLHHWKEPYSRSKFNNEPVEEGALWDRIQKLERLVVKLTLEKEGLIKGLQNSLANIQEKANHQGMGMLRKVEYLPCLAVLLLDERDN